MKKFLIPTIIISLVLVSHSLQATNFEVNTKSFFPQSVTLGPYIDGNNVIFTKDNRLYILDLEGNLVHTNIFGDELLKPKSAYFNSERVITVASGNKISLFKGEVLKELTFNNFVFEDHQLISDKLLVAFNYPALFDLDGNLIWERKDLETRFIQVLDVDSDGEPEIFGGTTSLFALSSDGDLLWQKDLEHIQPLVFANLDYDPNPEILFPTKEKLVALNSDGTELWVKSLNIVPSENPLITVFQNNIAVLTPEKIIILDNLGQTKSEIETNVYAKSLSVQDIDNDGLEEFIIANNLAVYSFSQRGLEWKQDLNEIKDLAFLNADEDKFIEILAGTKEGIILINIQEKKVDLDASFTSSKYIAIIDEPILFDASQSKPTNLQYRWNFGDESFDTGWSNSPFANHTYSSPGNYTIALEVTEGESFKTAKLSLTIFEKNQPPQARIIISPHNPEEREKFDILVQVTDRENDNVYYRFDADSDGIYESEWQRQGSLSHFASNPGAYVASVEVKDDFNPPQTLNLEYEVIQSAVNEEVEKSQFMPAITISVVVILLILIISVFIFSRKRHFN